MRNTSYMKNLVLIISISLILLAIASGSFAAFPEDSLAKWNRRSAFPQGNRLGGIAYGNGLFVAVGDVGTILTSPDGIAWTAQSSGTSSALNGVTYGNGTFVTVGDMGTMLTSPDGIAWTAQSSGTSSALNGVTYGNGKFVAVGGADYGTIVTSPDGVTWTTRFSQPLYPISGVTYGNGKFVAVGAFNTLHGSSGRILISQDGVMWTLQFSQTPSFYGGSRLLGVTYNSEAGFVAVGDAGKIMTSPDGIVWTTQYSWTSSALCNVTYGNGAFVAIGDGGTVVTSPDGIVWTPQSSWTSSALYGVAYGNGTFVAVGDDGTIVTSPDGATWTTQSYWASSEDPLDNWHLRNPVPESTPLRGVTCGNGIFVAVGDYGTIESSTDGTTWTSRDSGMTNTLTAVAYGNGIFVAVGYGAILTSSDGITWSRISEPGYLLDGIAYGNGIFVAVGYGAILTSSDGITWSRNFPGYSLDGGRTYSTGTFNGIVYGNGTFVVVSFSDDVILTSTDGIKWTAKRLGGGLYGIAYGNGTFVAVGGAVIISTDGITWSPGNQGELGELKGVTYGNGVFVAITETGDIITSPDGITWTFRYSADDLLYGITYGKGIFAVVGYSGRILISSDGVTWTSGNSVTKHPLNAVTYGNNLFVSGGPAGKMFFSMDGTDWHSAESGTPDAINGITFGNGMFVAAGENATIITSTDGIHWIVRNSMPATGSYVLNTVINGNGTFVALGEKGYRYGYGYSFQSTVFTSRDATNWIERELPPFNGSYFWGNGITYGNGTFVAVGADGKILRSTDGVQWSSIALGNVLPFLNGVTYGNGLFVAVSGAEVFGAPLYAPLSYMAEQDEGMVLTSPDGISWSSVQLGTDYYFSGIHYADGVFVAVGTFSKSVGCPDLLPCLISNDGSLIFTSMDAVHWIRRPVDTRSSLSAVTYGNNTFVAVGDEGVILQADPTTFTITANAGEHGSIAPSGSTTVNYGSSQTFTITPDTGYKVVDVLVDGESVGLATTYTFNNITANHTISATFTIITFTVISSAGEHGNISPDGPQTVNYNATTSFTVTPDAGYGIASISGCGGTLSGTTYMTSPVTADCAVSVTFGLAYKISGTVKNGNGFPMQGVTMTLNGGAIGTITTTTDSSGNYKFKGLVDGTYTITPGKDGYAFTKPGKTATIDGANVTNKNFFGSPVVISGTVTNSAVKPMPNVIVTLSGAGTSSTITDINGNYRFKPVPNGTYTITPSKPGKSFAPSSRAVDINSVSVTHQNFTGSKTTNAIMN